MSSSMQALIPRSCYALRAPFEDGRLRDLEEAYAALERDVRDGPASAAIFIVTHDTLPLSRAAAYLPDSMLDGTQSHRGVMRSA